MESRKIETIKVAGIDAFNQKCQQMIDDGFMPCSDFVIESERILVAYNLTTFEKYYVQQFMKYE